MTKTEHLRVTKVPKSAMQHIRQYTALRAFVELDDNGGPKAYYVEAEKTNNTAAKPNGRTNGKIPPTAKLQLTGRIKSTFYSAGTKHRLCSELIEDNYPPGCIESRSILTRVIAKKTGSNTKIVSNWISALIKDGFLKVVDES